MGNSSSQEEGGGSKHSNPSPSSGTPRPIRSPSRSSKHHHHSSSLSSPPQHTPTQPVAVTNAAQHQQTTPAAVSASGPPGSSSFQHNEFSHIENVVTPATTAADAGSAAISAKESKKPERPAPLRRKSTLLLKGEHEPEVDEDMEFHRLNIQPGVQPTTTKPLSRAGSGDEIQLGDDYLTETKYETLISWHQGGEKVYVTGTFTGWRRMIKLNKNDDNTFSIMLKLPAGTHRMRFVVDNELRCSDYMPSATDSMGNLVNYIEVGMDLDDDADMGMEPLHRTASHYEEQRKVQDSNYQQDQRYIEEQQRLQQQEQAQQQQQPDTEMAIDDDDLGGDGRYERFHEELPAEPEYKFTNEIPPVFTDPAVMDQFVASDYVTPPQLPPHLENVILNSNSNEKDNNSVLPIPNHVVLNHLATASIKHNVLAVASISRYSRKYVTQILYAPLC